MAGSEPHILLIGGDGGYSGVPTYLALLMAALSDGTQSDGTQSDGAPDGMPSGGARFTVLSDRNAGGYDFVARAGGCHIELPGLRTSLDPWRALRALRALARIIDSRQPDLVWAHARMGVFLLRLLAVWRRLRGAPMPPVAITFHGLPFGPGHRPLSRALAWLAEALFLRLMPPHHLVFLSEAAAARYAAGPGRGGAMARHPAHVLRNCARLDPLPPAPPTGGPVIVMVGRSGYQKNHRAAARILAHLPPDCRLVLCGAGTDTPAFRRRFARDAGLAEAGTGQRVRFVGPTADVRPLLQGADLFLLTSRYEGMPIAAIEAFEAGLPLALHDIPGMAEIAAAHPMAALLPPGQPARSAARVLDLIARYRQDPAGHNAAIRAAWQQGFSFARWRREMVGLTGQMTGPMTGRTTGPQIRPPHVGND